MYRLFTQNDDQDGWEYNSDFETLADAIADYGEECVVQVIPGVWSIHEEAKRGGELVALLFGPEREQKSTAKTS